MTNYVLRLLAYPRRSFVLLVAFTQLLAIHITASANDDAAQANLQFDTTGYVIDGVTGSRNSPSGKGRAPIHQDAVEWLLVTGDWQPPQSGLEVEIPGGEKQKWREVTVEKDGINLERALDGYASVTVQSDVERVMMLHLGGCRHAYFNGECHAGGYYQGTGVTVPVLVKKGSNQLVLRLTRRSGPSVRFSLTQSGEDFRWGPDMLPELIAGEANELWIGGMAANNSRKEITDLKVIAEWPDGPTTTTPLGRVAPLTFRRTSFAVRGPAVEVPSDQANANVTVKYTLIGTKDGSEQELSAGEFGLRVVDLNRLKDDYVRLTYRSSADGSVQYYAFRPSNPLPGSDEKPALFLAMHGASVDATTHASSYWRKSWGHIVSPTNRGPFGYNWEEFGRIDALEVMADVERRFHTDPKRVYATGHSMGGHGTWHLGVLYPDRFAAIAPSAGYPNLLGYVGRRGRGSTQESALEEMLARAEAPCQTENLVENLRATGVYILHGGTDGNVPTDEARRMDKLLATFHTDYSYHEEPGAGHWWTSSPNPNTGRVPCTDWDGIFDLFARRITPRPEEVIDVTFITPNPEISAHNQWLSIESQQEMAKNATARLRYSNHQRTFEGTTDNVSRLALDVDHLTSGPLNVQLDGQRIGNIPWPEEHGRIWLARGEDGWRLADKPSPKLKGPHRYGPFKQAFHHDFIMVYATQGTAEENAWAIAKARYDAETFWYQGKGSADLVPDAEFRLEDYPDRSVVLYGNADTNAAWPLLLEGGPVDFRRGRIKVGDRVLEGDSLACAFIRPRRDSDVACVAVVGGTGIVGSRLTDQFSYLVPGSNYPDLLVVNPQSLERGNRGIEAVGYFGEDWSVESGDFAWRENAIENYEAQWIPDSLTIDGQLDEAAWQRAVWSRRFADINGDGAPRPEFDTRVKMLWNDKYLYVAARLEEPHVWWTKTNRNSRIYDDNDFEVFIDPNGDGKNYYEFEMNASNTVWNLLLFKPYREGGGGLIPHDMPGQLSGVAIDGTGKDASDIDRGWTVEVAFPWEAMREYAGTECPPVDGDEWRINFSRVQWGNRIVEGKYERLPHPTGGGGHPEANWTWSPQGGGTMHEPARWGKLKLLKDQP